MVESAKSPGSILKTSVRVLSESDEFFSFSFSVMSVTIDTVGKSEELSLWTLGLEPPLRLATSLP